MLHAYNIPLKNRLLLLADVINMIKAAEGYYIFEDPFSVGNMLPFKQLRAGTSNYNMDAELFGGVLQIVDYPLI